MAKLASFFMALQAAYLNAIATSAGSLPMATRITYHVSPNVLKGVALAAAADGSPSRPFRTLVAARDAVRATLSATHASNVTVIVGAGTYTEHLQLTAADSGTASLPVVWRAAAGEEVRGSARIRLLCKHLH